MGDYNVVMPLFFILLLALLFRCIACAATQPDFDVSVWDLIRGHGDDAVNRFDTDPWDFDVFRSLLELAPSVKSVLDTHKHITVFLPNDLGCGQTANDVIALSNNASLATSEVNTEQNAFYSLQTNWLGRFENSTEALELWLNYHIVPQAFSFQEVLELGSFTFSTLADQTLDLVVTRFIHDDPRFHYSEITFAPPSQPLVEPRNGFVVVIDRMLFPSFSSLTLKEDAKQAFPSASSSSSSAPSPSVSTTPSPSPMPSKSETLSPSATPIPNADLAPACFPVSSRVNMPEGTSLPISRLEAGHEVLVSEKESSKIFLFSHRNVEGKHVFIQITSEHNHTIELTAGHYIYANKRRVAAYTVRKGDVVQTVDGPSHVRTVRQVVRRGLVAPHTLHGDIVINGIVCSTYTVTLTPLLAHSALLPLRLLVNAGLANEPLGSWLHFGAPWITSWLRHAPPFSKS